MTKLARPLAVIIILVAWCAAFLGCGRQPGKEKTAVDRGEKIQRVIGVSLLTLENPFFKVIGDTITAEAAKRGYEVVVLSADKDVAKQSNQVKDFMVRKVQAIVLSPCESRAIVPILQEANKAGIPVFTVDIPCHEKGVDIVCQIATDNYEGGKEAARAMIEALGPDGGKVAVLHFKQAESCRLRVKGFNEILEQHNKDKPGKIDIVAELEGGGLKDIAFKTTEDLLQSEARLRGIFAINDPSALGAWSAIEKAKRTKEIVIVGFDGQPEGKLAIKEGKIYADPIQYPDKMGVEAVRAIVAHSEGKKVDAEILIPTSLYRKADADKDPELEMTVPLLDMRGVGKTFPGVVALADLDLALSAGEVLGLVGENGAGKSTLIKILGGAAAPDSGVIALCGQAVHFRNPRQSLQAGVSVIHQELSLIPGLSARENIFLGQEKSRFGFVRAGMERAQARLLFQRLGLDLDPETPCRALSVAQQQGVEIAKALSHDARLLILDEPSAALSAPEVERLLQIVLELKRQGLGVIYVSHRLDEIDRIADRVAVLRDGLKVGDFPAAQLPRDELIRLMVGRALTEEFPPRQVQLGPERLEVRELRRGRSVRGVSFALRQGEVLGLAGLVGAGRTETARLIFGADPRDSGQILVNGRACAIAGPQDAIRAGIALLTEDRKSQGLILAHGARDNFALPNLQVLAHSGWVQRRQERERFAEYVRSLDIKLPAQNQAARFLSGGNQQKVVLAKWLERHCDILLMDEPTRGVDVAAKVEIYRLINRLAETGKSVLFISSELEELLGMCDRILVMREGRIVGEIADPRRASLEEILALAVLPAASSEAIYAAHGKG